jgi:ABC-2 type transport system permease protein
MTSFGRLLGAELVKIATLPATWIALAVATAGHVLLALAGRVEAGGLLLVPAYATAAVSVHAAGTEYRTGQFRITLAAAPNRGRLFAAKVMAGLAVCLLGTVFPALVVPYLLIALIGLGLAVITRSVVIPVAALGLAPILATILPPRVADLLPHAAALGLLHGRSGLLVLTTWAGLCTAGAWVLFGRRDS